MADEVGELDESVLAALRRKIKEEEANQMAAAKGAAIAKGYSGGMSSYQAVRESMAGKASLNAQTDAMVKLALERSHRQREERLIREDRTYRTSEREASERYNSLEQEKQRAYATGENEKARQFEAEQARLNAEWQAYQGRQQGRNDLVTAGISGVSNLGGQVAGLYAAKKFFPNAWGGQSPASGMPNVGGGAEGPALSGGQFFSAGGGATAAAPRAGMFSTGAAKLGGVAAGAGAYVAGSKALGATKKELLSGGGLFVAGHRQAGRAIKKVFCFDPETMIEMSDGKRKRISELQLGDGTAGGFVESIRVALADDRFIYKGQIVTGSHAVREGNDWLRVKDSMHSVPYEGLGPVVSIVTTLHRVYVDGIEFADEHEHDAYEHLTIDQSLELLNSMQKETLIG